jgi:hypothetical protein
MSRSAGGWTNLCVESGSSTRVGVDDRGKIQTCGNRRGFGLAPGVPRSRRKGHLIAEMRHKSTDCDTPEPSAPLPRLHPKTNPNDSI